ncbi:dynamin family protein [Exiguobacterium aurantiacum]|uniref:dynamin family protein n=1 Tax=Exiguobacterium aurantiacum TaxID=33987 RepID=UPI00384A6EDC
MNVIKEKKRILVTATMSAGKSTLVNALVGQRVMMTRNESCTSKPWVITEDPAADGLYAKHRQFKIKFKQSVAETLHHAENISLQLFTPMYRLASRHTWELIDTPGVNSTSDKDHQEVTEAYIRLGQYDVLLYVLNGSHLGTRDDLAHLRFVQNHVPHDKVIFVINKVDQFRNGQDSIATSLGMMEQQLKELGFTDPIIQPISAHAGYLMKRKLQEHDLSEDELDELRLYERKFTRPEFDLSTTKMAGRLHLLNQCGLYELEQLIERKDVTYE